MFEWPKRSAKNVLYNYRVVGWNYQDHRAITMQTMVHTPQSQHL